MMIQSGNQSEKNKTMITGEDDSHIDVRIGTIQLDTSTGYKRANRKGEYHLDLAVKDMEMKEH